MTVTELTIAKGAYSVTLYAKQIEDGFTNKLTQITPATGRQTQSSGPTTTKVVDLLRLVRSFRIDGYVVSNTVKSDLVKIIEGGGTDGGGITLTFSEGGDATSFTVFVESCIFTYQSQDEPTSPPSDQAKHAVNITLIKGEQVG